MASENAIAADIWGESDNSPVFDEVINPEEINPDDDSSARVEASDATEDVEDKTKEEDSEEAAPIEAATEDTAKATQAKADAVNEAKKAVKFKAGDKEIALDENAVFEWKVDGKKQPIALKDLIANYAGVVPVQKRLEEVSKARKEVAAQNAQFEDTRQRHSRLITDMHSNVTQGKVFEAVANMIEMAGSKTDPREFVRTLRDGLIQQAQELAKMSAYERAVLEEREAREYSESKYNRLVSQQKQQAEQAAYHERVNKAMLSVGATMEEYAETKAFVEQTYRDQKKDLSQVTPEKIAQIHKDTKDYRTARDAMKEVGLDPEKDGQLWDLAVQTYRLNPGWTQEDLRDTLKEAATIKRSKSISKKIAKAPVATVAAAAAKAKTAPVSDKAKQRANALLQDPAAYGEFSEADLDW